MEAANSSQGPHKAQVQIQQQLLCMQNSLLHIAQPARAGIIIKPSMHSHQLFATQQALPVKPELLPSVLRTSADLGPVLSKQQATAGKSHSVDSTQTAARNNNKQSNSTGIAADQCILSCRHSSWKSRGGAQQTCSWAVQDHTW